jgi:hypothetical protein
MFIIDVIKKEEARGELKLLYKMIEKSLGFVPSHFELFATIDIEAMREFMAYNQSILNHKAIDKNLLPYLRLEIAKRECRNYCINFNSEMIKKMNLDDTEPYDAKQALLLEKILKSIYETKLFDAEDLRELKENGFSNKDYFDLLSYATNFMAKSKMIEVYSKGEA